MFRPIRIAAILFAPALVAGLLASPAVAAASGPEISSTSSVSGSLTTLISDLPVDDVAHPGYDRALFNHWIDADGDGCDTREEVLLAEATVAPTQGSGCALSGGEWDSWYDGATWTDKADVDIDHVVALGESWPSGTYNWTASRREAYANDLGDSRSLEGVTDNVNQSKGDRDPAEWMPPLSSVTCKYIGYWVAVKTRWQLTVDSAEQSALEGFAAGCPNVTITVTIA